MASLSKLVCIKMSGYISIDFIKYKIIKRLQTPIQNIGLFGKVTIYILLFLYDLKEFKYYDLNYIMSLGPNNKSTSFNVTSHYYIINLYVLYIYYTTRSFIPKRKRFTNSKLIYNVVCDDFKALYNISQCLLTFRKCFEMFQIYL